MRQAVILAGGQGTRLKDRLGDLPKPLIPIAGKPLLEHQIELLKKHQIEEVIIFACYRPDLIEDALGNGARWSLRIHYEIEKDPLGTAGAVLAGFEKLADRFVVLYGDTMVNVDLGRIARVHEHTGADATLLVHPNDHPMDSDLLEVSEQGWITAFHNRPHPQGIFRQNLVNAALYVLNKDALRSWAGRANGMDFGKDLFPRMLSESRRLLGYNSPEYIKDIGTPERYDRVVAEFANGLVQRSSLEAPQRAVFLDRDGTLNREVDGVTSPDKLELLPGTAEAIHLLNHHGWRTVVVSNQPVIAKGFCTEAEVKAVHNKLETLLGMEHAFLDRIYYCPHHPEKGFAGERADLKRNCACRKPSPGMILNAVRDLNIDLKSSWMVGDTTTDVQTAKNAGVKSILLKSGYGGQDGKHSAQPDHVFASLLEAARFIVTQDRT